MVEFFDLDDKIVDVRFVGIVGLFVVVMDVIDFVVEVDGVVFCYVGLLNIKLVIVFL